MLFLFVACLDCAVGWFDGDNIGCNVGYLVAVMDGLYVGDLEGWMVWDVGVFVGDFDGVFEGDVVGGLDGVKNAITLLTSIIV